MLKRDNTWCQQVDLKKEVVMDVEVDEDTMSDNVVRQWGIEEV